MNHSLTKLFLVTNMHLYIDPKRGFKKFSNFEQVHHFCSKKAVQKQWSMANILSWSPAKKNKGFKMNFSLAYLRSTNVFSSCPPANAFWKMTQFTYYRVSLKKHTIVQNAPNIEETFELLPSIYHLCQIFHIQRLIGNLMKF